MSWIPGRALTAASSLVATFALLEGTALACPCQGSSGPISGVTTQYERFGFSVTETARFGNGTWHPDGRYAAFGDQNSERSLDFGLLAGYRPVPKFEVSGELAYGHQSFLAPYVADDRTGFGDATLRVRWDALEQPMPYEHAKLPWPSLTIVASLRMPIATQGDSKGDSSGRTGSIGSSASSEGLGAWEPSLGVVLVREVATNWEVIGYFEGAYRFADTWLNVERHLAPRFLAQAGVRYTPTMLTALGLFTDLGWEGNVAYRGVDTEDSGQRIWTVGLYGSFRTSVNGLRWGGLFRYAPPVNDIGKNATATTTFGVSTGYAF